LQGDNTLRGRGKDIKIQESVSEISNDIIGESAESLTEPQKQEVKNKINIDE
jgi:hypothetical protein